MHGGGIDFESIEGEGTTFYIRLPRYGPIDDGSVTEGDERQREHDTHGYEPMQLSA
jgi:hypothetical protein